MSRLFSGYIWGWLKHTYAFLFHEVDGQGSLDSVVPDEEVQGKSDVGASEDPPSNCDFKHFLQILLNLE